MSNAAASGPTGLHSAMRAATAEAHDDLDHAFAVFDLADPSGFESFLAVHHAAMATIAPIFADFVTGTLAMPAPDYLAMLAADMGHRAPPAAPAPDALDGLGAAYVVAGSRLGLAVLRKRGFARPSRYMDDRAGLDVWRTLTGWMVAQPNDAAARRRAGDSARAGFAVFADALAAATARCPA